MLLYIAAIVLSAFLLFQVQPMIAKMILPWFGGSAAVWITAMLFFQAALLGGYLYAHWSIRSLRPRTQAVLHIALIAASLAFLPIAPAASWRPLGNEDPSLRILGLLTVSIGLPYFLLSTTSPLIQAWYGRRFRSALPYKLFGLSNLASLLGLLAYPFLVEPHVTLSGQSIGWSAGYAVFALLAGGAAVAGAGSKTPSEPSSVPQEDTDDAPPRLRDRLLWVVLAACGSTLLLAVTNHLTQNVASIPFLWVLPLGLYLLTFIIAFDYERLYHRRMFQWLVLGALVAMAAGLWRWDSRTSLKLVIPVFSAGLFIACMFCHGELVGRKPSPRYLTTFYLMLSAGGALGGLLVGLAAPKLLSGYFELPLALIALAALMLFLIEYRNRMPAVIVAWVAVLVSAAFCFQYLESYREASRVMVRSFYGGLRVHDYEQETENEVRALVHGTVNHGMQFVLPERRREHITYYGPESGIALAITSLRHSNIKAGVLGLGAGSLAAFGEKGDVFRFYEINPQVVRIAQSEFTYLSDAPGRTDIVMGDGRLSLEREPDQQYDLLVADAFSGDAVPTHLLTKQALELYFRHLKPTGILALNITNTHLELAPVVDRLAQALGKHFAVVSNDTDEDDEVFHARWALLSSRPLPPAIMDEAEELEPRPDIRVWTDDYNNLFQILK